MLSYYGDSKSVILESTVKVILVKFIVSPYSPINAYFAVILQSILGYFLFFNGFNRISPILLGLLALLFSALQKIIILTLVFGMTLWESIDIFFDFVVTKLMPYVSEFDPFSLSYVLVGAYVLSHILGGVLAGFYASRLPERINEHDEERIIKLNSNINDFLEIKPKKKQKRKWWLKKSSIAFFVFSIIVITISFIFEEVDKNIATQVLIMLGRSTMIIIIWYYFISPFLLKFVNKLLSEKKKKRADEIESIVNVFPSIKSIIKYSWSETKQLKGLKRIVIFFDRVLIHYLLFEQIIDE